MKSGCRLKHRGEFPLSVEGYNQAEWMLVDYGDFLVHIFSPKSRALLRSGTAVAQCQDRRNPGRVKVFLYYIGKPRDAHANR